MIRTPAGTQNQGFSIKIDSSWAAFDQVAPGSLGGLDADTEEREPRFLQDGAADPEGQGDPHRPHRIGEDLPEEDGHCSPADTFRRLDILFLADGQNVSIDQFGDAGPSHNPDHQDQGDKRRTDYRHQHQNQESCWERP